MKLNKILISCLGLFSLTSCIKNNAEPFGNAFFQITSFKDDITWLSVDDSNYVCAGEINPNLLCNKSEQLSRISEDKFLFDIYSYSNSSDLLLVNEKFKYRFSDKNYLYVNEKLDYFEGSLLKDFPLRKKLSNASLFMQAEDTELAFFGYADGSLNLDELKYDIGGRIFYSIKGAEYFYAVETINSGKENFDIYYDVNRANNIPVFLLITGASKIVE